MLFRGVENVFGDCAKRMRVCGNVWKRVADPCSPMAIGFRITLERRGLKATMRREGNGAREEHGALRTSGKAKDPPLAMRGEEHGSKDPPLQLATCACLRVGGSV